MGVHCARVFMVQSVRNRCTPVEVVRCAGYASVREFVFISHNRRHEAINCAFRKVGCFKKKSSNSEE